MYSQIRFTLQAGMITDITPKYAIKSNVLKEIEAKFLKSAQVDQHKTFKTKIDLLRQSSPPNKFRVKKNSKSLGKSSNKRYEIEQIVPFDEYLSTQFAAQTSIFEDRKTTSALNVYPSENLIRQSEQDYQLPQVKCKQFMLKELTIENPRFSMSRVSIINKNNLFLVPYLKNKLRQMNSDTNCPHIADIPVVHSLTSQVTKRSNQLKTQGTASRNKHHRNNMKLIPKDDFGPW